MNSLFSQQISQVEILNFQTFTTEYVSEHYGISKQTVIDHKRNHTDEIIENIHFIYELTNTKGGKQEVLKWTLRGIIKLGMFIRSPQAKNFRLWAEMELEKSINKELENARIARENNLRLVDKVSDLEATLINKANRHQKQINGYKGQIAQHNQKIELLKAKNTILKHKNEQNNEFLLSNLQMATNKLKNAIDTFINDVCIAIK
ncbi:hypothetical protein [Campylobacter suis]|uniref:Bro-N domain-containing protein n=1 Tax=Campylobacter suis TaxID=2790657 RepID=A0ABM8Q5U8_9BACT|nr:hypothetical protein [Campylobacter suis]CAD7288262.1 hypothetical protein LMG8286_01230 [Campylobacter suis]